MSDAEYQLWATKSDGLYTSLEFVKSEKNIRIEPDGQSFVSGSPATDEELGAAIRAWVVEQATKYRAFRVELPLDEHRAG